MAAALRLIWRDGLAPVAIVALLGLFVWKFLFAPDSRVEALERKLDAHAATMEIADKRREAAELLQNTRLKGICYGVTREGSLARALCDQP